MNISKVYIETINNGKLAPEMQNVYDVMIERRIPIELFIQKHIQRNRLEIKKDTPVIGFVDSMLTAFRLLKIDIPSTNDYPIALKPYYRRRIWESDVRRLKDQIYAGHLPVFAKPKNRKKRFTGTVFSSIDDLYLLHGLSNQMELYCSEVIDWVSEYRVYVIESKIVGIHHYDGDPIIKPDALSIKNVIRILDESSTTTAGYAIDLGILSTGELALVEWNDGFSLGSYGLGKNYYTDLLLARWNELTVNLQ